jgi:hypothetical protein
LQTAAPLQAAFSFRDKSVTTPPEDIAGPEVADWATISEAVVHLHRAEELPVNRITAEQLKLERQARFELQPLSVGASKVNITSRPLFDKVALVNMGAGGTDVELMMRTVVEVLKYVSVFPTDATVKLKQPTPVLLTTNEPDSVFDFFENANLAGITIPTVDTPTNDEVPAHNT